MGAVCLIELFAGTRALPYNHPTFPEAWSSIRPAMTQLLAANAAGAPPGRFLSMSALQFDPGDLAELHSAWDGQLPAPEITQAVVDTKHKEVLSPNLPLAWRIPAVDGFDGGILPLRNYAEFSRLLLPGGEATADGRLRENLTQAPPVALLDLVGVRYLITDKVDDRWIAGVYYDVQFSQELGRGAALPIGRLPRFQATALRLLLDLGWRRSGSWPDLIGYAQLPGENGWNAPLPIPAPGPDGVAAVAFGSPLTPRSLTVLARDFLTVRAATLVDERSGAFQSLTLGPFRLVHSGDVKIYENPGALPRAFVVPEATVVPDDAAARAALSAPDFDPASAALLAAPEGTPVRAGEEAPHAGTTLGYEAERVRVQAAGPGILILTDAFYPGWTARVDGVPAPILRADVMFRAVVLPEGEHTVEFVYAPRAWSVGWKLSLAGLALWLALILA